ncbi:MAG TPA: SRPBCC family protein [Candidatus Eisenbacteria bacterium]
MRELRRSQVIPVERNRVFEFFADAGNLEEITPSWLRFHVVSPMPIVMKPGVRIEYALRLHAVPIRWISEITEWEPPFRFVDRQVRGPYRLWVHEHRFDALPGGTVVSDHVRYSAPGGPLVHRFLVAPDLKKIFDYRASRISVLLPAS